MGLKALAWAILAVSIFIAFTLPGRAEIFVLDEQGYWTVSYTDDDTSSFCSMTNHDGGSFGIALNVNDYGLVTLQIHDAEVKQHADNELDLYVDDLLGWEVSGEGFESSTFIPIGNLNSLTPGSAQILDEIRSGYWLAIYPRDAGGDDWLYKFSLKGTNAMMEVLFDCVFKMGVKS